jgi:hypothetical protein
MMRLIEQNLTSEQTEFFKNSKIRNIHGKLLPVYRADVNDFNTFDESKIGNGGYLFGKGLYFTFSEEIARDYGDLIREFYLNITNPFYYNNIDRDVVENILKNSGFDDLDIKLLDKVFDGGCDFYDGDLLDDILERVYPGNKWYENLSEIVKKLGYDGIVADNEIVAFYPNQIKLTTNTHPTSSASINERFGTDFPD